MPERTGGPTDTNSPDASHSEQAQPPAPAAAPRTGWERPTEPEQPVDSRKPIDTVQPIEVGDGPFELTEQAADEDEKPKPKTRTRTMVLAGLLAVGLAGAAVLGITGWRVASQKDATLAAPAQIGNLAIDDTEEGRATADYLTTALAAEVDFDKTVGAVYRDAGLPDKGVLFFGGTTLIWSPGNDLDTAFELIADDQGAVTGVHDVEPGTLGGSMKCGATATADGELTVCGWADHGSLAIALFPGRPEAESAGLMRTIRAATQTRN